MRDDTFWSGILFFVVGWVVLAGLWFLLGNPVERNECRVRAEYAATAADTAALVKRIPLCAKVVYDAP